MQRPEDNEPTQSPYRVIPIAKKGIRINNDMSAFSHLVGKLEVYILARDEIAYNEETVDNQEQVYTGNYQDEITFDQEESITIQPPENKSYYSDLDNGASTGSTEQIDHANMFDLPEGMSEESLKRTDRVQSRFLEHFLRVQAPLLVGCDTAIGQAEAVMRDCFGVEASIEDTVTPVLEDVFTLEQAALGFKYSKDIPKKVVLTYLDKLSNTLAERLPEKLSGLRKARSAKDYIAGMKRHKSSVENAQVRPNQSLGILRNGGQRRSSGNGGFTNEQQEAW